MTARRTAFSAYLASRGAAPSIDERLLDAMGAVARDRLLPEGAASVAWDMAALAGLDDDDERRAFALIVLAVILATSSGSTCLSLSGATPPALVRDALATIRDVAAPIEAALADGPRLAARATGVVGPTGSDRPLLLRESTLAPARLYRAEEGIAAALRRLAPRPLAVTQALSEVVAAPTRDASGAPTSLTDEQRAAVAAACEEGLSVITGGPGTGKTSVLVALLRTLVRAGVSPGSIALAAPTGKAAERMTGATSAALASLVSPAPVDVELSAALPRASTLHRLLGYSPALRAFSRGASDPLPHEIVIVDEASMIDVELGRALADALSPHARLVLLGDPEQLPPVGAGALLQDVASARPDSVRRLTVSHRMRASDPAGSAVLAFSRAIARGDMRDAEIATRATSSDLTWRGVEHIDAASAHTLLDRLAELHLERVGLPLRRTVATIDGAPSSADARWLAGLLAAVARVRLLSPVHAGPLGTEALSRELQDRVVRRLPRAYGGPPPGTPILVTENDYARGLFNGDQGLVVRVARGATTALEVAFAGERGGVTLHPWDALAPRVETTHALTVHKSQGSECDVVVLSLADTPEGLASRALLYTAVTRAKTGVVLVGELSTLQHRVRAAGERSSSLRELLSRPG